MSKSARTEVLPADLRDHRAVKAWREISAEWFEPEKIEILKLKNKTSVYRLAGAGSNGSAIIAKRCRAASAAVERLIYEEFLARSPMPALRCYGFMPETESEFCWLFLEDAGANQYSPAKEAHRALAGRWLGTIHRAPLSADLRALLPDRGPGHYLQLLRSSRARMLERVDNPAFSADEVALLRTLIRRCDLIEAHWEALERYCEGVPRTLLHGDFVSKNIRVRPGTTGPALLVFDWEMAGWGAPATDLAQFMGPTVSPDLGIYCSVLRRDFPQLDVRDIQRLADYGDLLRVVDKIFWVTVTMVHDDYEYLRKPLVALRQYEWELAVALQTLHWRSND